jgi:hypothetical protein
MVLNTQSGGRGPPYLIFYLQLLQLVLVISCNEHGSAGLTLALTFLHGTVGSNL